MHVTVASKSFSEFQDHYSVVNLLLTLTHSLCLLILSCSMLFYGIRLQQKLGNSSLKAIPGKTRKIAILLRINIVLLICCVCFFLRVIALAMLCRDIVLNSTFTDDKILLIGWFIISNWLPTTFPVFHSLFCSSWSLPLMLSTGCNTFVHHASEGSCKPKIFQLDRKRHRPNCSKEFQHK